MQKETVVLEPSITALGKSNKFLLAIVVRRTTMSQKPTFWHVYTPKIQICLRIRIFVGRILDI